MRIEERAAHHPARETAAIAPGAIDARQRRHRVDAQLATIGQRRRLRAHASGGADRLQGRRQELAIAMRREDRGRAPAHETHLGCVLRSAVRVGIHRGNFITASRVLAPAFGVTKGAPRVVT